MEPALHASAFGHQRRICGLWNGRLEERQRLAVEAAAQLVLDARAVHADASLADLYDPTAMPPNLAKAHRDLDRAVDAAYLARLPTGMAARPKLDTDGRRVSFLFTLFASLTTLITDAAETA